jgi:hypothetical protein
MLSSEQLTLKIVLVHFSLIDGRHVDVRAISVIVKVWRFAGEWRQFSCHKKAIGSGLCNGDFQIMAVLETCKWLLIFHCQLRVGMYFWGWWVMEVQYFVTIIGIAARGREALVLVLFSHRWQAYFCLGNTCNSWKCGVVTGEWRQFSCQKKSSGSELPAMAAASNIPLYCKPVSEFSSFITSYV